MQSRHSNNFDSKLVDLAFLKQIGLLTKQMYAYGHQPSNVHLRFINFSNFSSGHQIIFCENMRFSEIS